MLYKEYIKELFKGKRIRFRSDCLLQFDITGVVVDAEQVGSEILFVVDVQGRLIKIGENTSKLRIDFV